MKVTDRTEENEEIPRDIHWDKKVRIVFVPSKGLNKRAASIIKQDYDMKKGKAIVWVRRALLEYFLLENGLLKSKTAEPGENAEIRGDNGQIAIHNARQIRMELKSLRAKPA